MVAVWMLMSCRISIRKILITSLKSLLSFHAAFHHGMLGALTGALKCGCQESGRGSTLRSQTAETITQAELAAADAMTGSQKMLNLGLMDTSIAPGDDFYAYANGAWLDAATSCRRTKPPLETFTSCVSWLKSGCRR